MYIKELRGTWRTSPRFFDDLLINALSPTNSLCAYAQKLSKDEGMSRKMVCIVMNLGGGIPSQNVCDNKAHKK